MSIPKVIHYCWFGGNPLPDNTKRYMESWKKFCPDFEIIEWNESNFDVTSCRFVKEAYDSKKWAFVSDYVRFYAMFNYGGIYIETDAEVIRPIDDLLKYNAFFGLAGTDTTLSMCGACKGNEIAKAVLEKYNSKVFILENGKYNTVTINKELFDILERLFPLEKTDSIQVVGDNNAIYPERYFYSYDYMTGQFHRNEDLYVIHYGDGSWLDPSDRKRLDYQHKAVKKYGSFAGVYIGKIKFYYDEYGLLGVVRRIATSIKNRLLRYKDG